LARLLITRADPWAALRFNRAMRSGETLITPLSDPLPVYLTYFTSWVDAAGEVHFRPDIYRRDTRLILALAREDPHVTARLEDGSLPASL
jgi:murein L,D-transpeptidase YcbB/YkuD